MGPGLRVAGERVRGMSGGLQDSVSPWVLAPFVAQTSASHPRDPQKNVSVPGLSPKASVLDVSRGMEWEMGER